MTPSVPQLREKRASPKQREQNNENKVDVQRSAINATITNTITFASRGTTQRNIFALPSEQRMCNSRKLENTNTVVETRVTPDETQTSSTNAAQSPTNGTAVHTGISTRYVSSAENGVRVDEKNSGDFKLHAESKQKRLSKSRLDTTHNDSMNRPISSLLRISRRNQETSSRPLSPIPCMDTMKHELKYQPVSPNPSVDTIKEGDKKEDEKKRREKKKEGERTQGQSLKDGSSTATSDASKLKGKSPKSTLEGHFRKPYLPTLRNQRPSSRIETMKTEGNGRRNISPHRKQKRKQSRGCVPLRKSDTSSGTSFTECSKDCRLSDNVLLSSEPLAEVVVEGGVGGGEDNVESVDDTLRLQKREQKYMDHGGRASSADDAIQRKNEVEENNDDYMLLSMNETTFAPLKNIDFYKCVAPNLISETINTEEDSRSNKDLPEGGAVPTVPRFPTKSEARRLYTDDNTALTRSLTVALEPLPSNKSARFGSIAGESTKIETGSQSSSRYQDSRPRQRKGSWWADSSLRKALSRLHIRRKSKNAECNGESESVCSSLAQLHHAERKHNSEKRSTVVSPVRALPPSSSRRVHTPIDCTHSLLTPSLNSGKVMSVKRCDASAFHSVVVSDARNSESEMQPRRTSEGTSLEGSLTQFYCDGRRAPNIKQSYSSENNEAAVFISLGPFLTVEGGSLVGNSSLFGSNFWGADTSEDSLLSF
ncbi:hypothetical protein LSM04_009455 [Trypanosoma melophagium]|uniref:uncharacterized protein n=1 Tax=Trypanosoma melophagium TaxID=715481 RepID=UPI00351A530B|nr:hypothetical protein LSM04_009455 [Trypanosoma melophagium]